MDQAEKVHVKWPTLPPSVLVAMVTACHSPSGLISPWWMTTSRRCSAVLPLKKRMQTQRDAWSSSMTGPAQGTITAAQPLKWCRMIFFSLTLHCNSSKSSSTMVLSNCLAGGRMLPLLRECLEDLAILRWIKARYQLQVCNLQPAHFQGSYFWYYMLSVVYCIPYCLRVSAVNIIRHWKRVVSTTISDTGSHPH